MADEYAESLAEEYGPGELSTIFDEAESFIEAWERDGSLGSWTPDETVDLVRGLVRYTQALRQFAQHKEECGLDRSKGWPPIRLADCSCGLGRL